MKSFADIARWKYIKKKGLTLVDAFPRGLRDPVRDPFARSPRTGPGMFRVLDRTNMHETVAPEIAARSRGPRSRPSLFTKNFEDTETIEKTQSMRDARARGPETCGGPRR